MAKQKCVKAPEVSDSHGIYYLDQYFSGKGTGKSIEDITRLSEKQILNSMANKTPGVKYQFLKKIHQSFSLLPEKERVHVYMKVLN